MLRAVELLIMIFGISCVVGGALILGECSHVSGSRSSISTTPLR
jgi:hypothetical protein